METQIVIYFHKGVKYLDKKDHTKENAYYLLRP